MDIVFSDDSQDATDNPIGIPSREITASRDHKEIESSILVKHSIFRALYKFKRFLSKSESVSIFSQVPQFFILLSYITF